MKNKMLLLLSTILLAVNSFAQETAKIDVDIDKGGDSTWYTQPWVWVVGGALFILLLVGMLKGGKKE
jgi:hypothetical protein